MSLISRNLDKSLIRTFQKQVSFYSTNVEQSHSKDEFRVLNLKQVKGQITYKKQPRKLDILPPRSKQMAVDQDWGSVWPAPKSFHPATVPLPIRQGYVEKGASPHKFANAELMKIPNFLHITPPVIKRQCEALKQFCTPWPKNLDSEEKIQHIFPIEIISSDYCHASPTIRDPLARIVTLKLQLSSLKLNERAKDKYLRLVGERYDEKTDTVTIVTDRCPMKNQNYDYAMYLITALYHESNNVEPWEATKSEADMEVYIWNKNASKATIEKLFAKPTEEIPNVKDYETAVSSLMNEGENDYTLSKYNEAVRQVLNLPQK